MSEPTSGVDALLPPNLITKSGAGEDGTVFLTLVYRVPVPADPSVRLTVADAVQDAELVDVYTGSGV